MMFEREASEQATRLTQEREAEYIQKLKDAGMKVIGPEEGLDIKAFQERVTGLVDKRFGGKYAQLYKDIRAIK